MIAKRLKKPADRDAWLALRRLGISGTDIAAIAGESSYRSPLSVYVDKTSNLPPTEANEAMELGSYMEDPIANLWVRKNPEARIKKINTVLQHPKYDWVLGNIDRHIIRPSEGILEVKCVGPYGMKRWGTDEEPDIPTEYRMQVMWYMIVTGLRTTHMAALLGGTKFVQRIVEYDKELAEAMLEIGHRFWFEHVKAGIPPAIDGGDATADLINRMFTNPQPITVELPHLKPWIDQYDRAKEQLDLLEMELEQAKSNIKHAMGDHCEAAICGDCQPTWKARTTNRFDTTRFKKDYPLLYGEYTNPTTSRVLVVRPPRKKE